MRSALQAFFTPANRVTPQFVGIWLALAVFGLAHWHYFFGKAPLALTFEDWPKERVYLNVLREAVAAQTPPLHTDIALQNTNRFLANPETLLGPQIFLLPRLNDSQFIKFQAVLMFLIGLTGCGLLARRFQWSAFTFGLFAAVFCFNGWLTAKLAVGQFMFLGYYWFPWMLFAVARLLDAPRDGRSPVAIAWMVFVLFLNGSFHLAVWWVIFLCVIALVRAEARRPLLLAAVWSAGLCLFRLAPAAVAYSGLKRGFAGGYPSLTTLLEGLVVSRPYETPFLGLNGFFGRGFGWWEFDCFIGLAAAVFMAVFAVRGLRAGNARSRPLLTGAAVMAVLALTFFYAPIAMSPLPLANSEIVTSRFFSVTFVVFLFFACEGFEGMAGRLSTTWQVVACVLLLETLAELAFHSILWRVGALEIAHAATPSYPDAATMQGHIVSVPGDSLYVTTVALSWTVSGLAILGSAAIWWRAGRMAQAQS